VGFIQWFFFLLLMSFTFKIGLSMFLVPINISIFRFSPSKIFLQLLVPVFNLIFVFFQWNCAEICRIL